MAARRYRLTGRVQGVGFRYFTYRSAQRLGVTGWVRNREDGDVEVHAEATEPGRIGQDVGRVGIASERDRGRMLDENQLIADLVRLAGADKLALDVPRLPVACAAKIADFTRRSAGSRTRTGVPGRGHRGFRH